MVVCQEPVCAKGRKEAIMSDGRHDKDGDNGPVFSAEQARQGEIILRTRTRRVMFIAGLVGIVILAIVVRLAIG
ncbi:hypothetical protein A4R28_07745 [Mesorhizobium ciceri]|nr:hypothetical protein A4R28_07745 [Mesorhizobium ciceri]